MRNKIFDDYKDIKDSITNDYLAKEYEDYSKRLQVPDHDRKLLRLIIKMANTKCKNSLSTEKTNSDLQKNPQKTDSTII